MTQASHRHWSCSARADRDLRAVRWAAWFFLLLDSTDLVVGLLAPGPLTPGPSPTEVFQTLLGLAACGCVLWFRWRAATALSLLLIALMVLHRPVGVELSLLVIAAVTLAVALPTRALLASLPATMTYACLLGYSLHRANETGWLSTIAMTLALAVLATALGAVSGRLLRDREESRRAVQVLHAQNLEIRTEERRQLSGQLQSILSRDFATMLAIAQTLAESREAMSVRDDIARLGALSRTTMTSMRLALVALRADPELPPDVGGRGSEWIDALGSPRTRRLLRGCAAILVTAAVLQVLWLPTSAESSTARVLQTVVILASPLTLVAALELPRPGHAMAVLVLAAGLVAPEAWPWLAAPTALLCFSAGRHGRWYSIPLAVLALLGYIAAQVALGGSQALALVGVLEGTAVVSLLCGLTLSYFEGVRDALRATTEQLHTEKSRIAVEERAGVARELHDVVGHQLSLVSLHSLAVDQEADRAVLQASALMIRGSLEQGHCEINQLVGMLLPLSEGTLPHAASSSPTQTSRELASQLEGHRFTARFSIDPRVDSLDPATQHTTSRILQESVSNILRHAPRRATCTVAAVVDDYTVLVVARSPLPSSPPTPHPAGGYGLRGIRERVDLTGGSFFAGPVDDAWEVRVCLRR